MNELSTSQEEHELLVLVLKRNGSVRLRNSLRAAQRQGFLDGLTIQAIVANDVVAIKRLMLAPNFGAKSLAELKKIVLVEYEANETYAQSGPEVISDCFVNKSRLDCRARISYFVAMDAVPNLPFKLSKVYINKSLLSVDEKKLLRKIEKLFGRMDLKSFFSVDEQFLLESGGFGAKYISVFRGLIDSVADELLDIVDGRKSINVKVKSIFVVAEYYCVDFNEAGQIVLDDVEEYLFSIDDESRSIIMSRWGFHCKSESLEVLGERFCVTRERIRQRVKDIVDDLLPTLRIHSDVLRGNVMKDRTQDFYRTLHVLSSCFDGERCFYSFLEMLCKIDKGGVFNSVHPEVNNTFLDSYFCENSSPINKEALIGELVSSHGYDNDQAVNVLVGLESKHKLNIVSGEVFPINLGKIEAVAHVLLSHPNGLPWKDIARVVNRIGCCSTPISENRSIASYLGGSDYVYLCGRGVYRHINFLDMSAIDVQSIMDDILEYVCFTGSESIHLNDFYHQAKQSIKVIDYFDFRHIVRAFCSEYGFYFNGKSGVDGLGVTEKFTRVTQKKLILEIMNKAKGAITKAEVAERLRSKSIAHASFYLDKMMADGDVVRIDNMMYTTPDRAFSNIDTEKILQLINGMLADTVKIIEADVFRREINSVLNVGYTKYFYAALASINIDKFGWKKKYNLFSCVDIPYQSLNDAFSSLCSPLLSSADNIEEINKIFVLTDQVMANGLSNWRASLL